MAKDDESEILALHMLELSDSHFSASDSQHLQELYFYLQLAENRFNEFLKKPYLKGVNVIPLVKHFKVFQEVNDIAESVIRVLADFHRAGLISMQGKNIKIKNVAGLKAKASSVIQ